MRGQDEGGGRRQEAGGREEEQDEQADQEEEEERDEDEEEDDDEEEEDAMQCDGMRCNAIAMPRLRNQAIFISLLIVLPFPMLDRLRLLALTDKVILVSLPSHLPTVFGGGVRLEARSPRCLQRIHDGSQELLAGLKMAPRLFQ